VKLSNIARALGEPIKLKKTEERLSHHLGAPGMSQVINQVLAASAADQVKEDTLLVIDPSDISKPYARRMPYLAKVRDGSRKEVVPGYWSCLAVACFPEQRRVLPMHMRLWSAEAPDYASENHQLLEIVRTVHTATQGRGIFVIDRGGDRIELLRPFLNDRVRLSCAWWAIDTCSSAGRHVRPWLWPKPVACGTRSGSCGRPRTGRRRTTWSLASGAFTFPIARTI
jgi:hypothetical protein